MCLLATSSYSSVISTPITLPFSPTSPDAKKQSLPAPNPKSRIVQPSIAGGIGLPHP